MSGDARRLAFYIVLWLMNCPDKRQQWRASWRENGSRAAPTLEFANARPGVIAPCGNVYFAAIKLSGALPSKTEEPSFCR